MGTASEQTATTEVEAARYAVLRRLAPAMRHHMVVNLQPIGMLHEVMERRLKSPSPDLASVQESAAKINGFARAALVSCLDVVTWLSPEDGATTSVAEGVKECLGLLSNAFNFRGFTIRDETGAQGFVVRRSATRNVLTASLMAIADGAQAPATITLKAAVRGNQAVLTLTLEPGEGKAGFPDEGAYRKLQWADVAALAQGEGVGFARDGATVTLTLAQAG